MKRDREKLLMDNQGLVYYVLRRQFPTLANDEDIAQAGMIGLWRACELFDKEKGKFSTFAIYWIRVKILHELRDRKRYHRVPICLLDAPITEDGTCCIGDLVEDKTFDPACSGIFLKEYLKGLGELEQQIITGKLQGLHQHEIAAIAGISQASVSRTLRKIKEGWQRL